MTHELSKHFDSLAAELPERQDDSESGYFSLSLENLPEPPSHLTTSEICLNWHYHFYNGSPVDLVTFELDKPTCRHLALLVLACAFHEVPDGVQLELTHPRSKIRRLVVDSSWKSAYPLPGLIARPHRLDYYPDPPTLHPWDDISLSPWDMPFLALTNEDDYIVTHEHIQSRDIAVGFGRFEPACHFGELMLNASLPQSETNEIVLEGERGYRGVAPGSAEITIWLPGGLGYLDAPVRD